MRITEKQLNKKAFMLNGIEYPKTWLNLSTIYENNQDWVKVIVCIGENSIGKTYSVENLFFEYIKQKKNVIWGRNTMLQSRSCVNGWNETLRRNSYEYILPNGKKSFIDYRKSYHVGSKGVEFYRTTNGKKWKNAPIELVCPFIYLSSPDNSIPQIENVHLFCIDEFLQGNEKNRFVCENPLYIIRQMMKRTTRDFANIKPCLFLLANPHNEAESDILCQLGIYPDAEKLYKREDEIWYDKEMGIIYLSFLNTNDWENERLKEQGTYFNSFMDSSSNYSFKNPAFKRIVDVGGLKLQPLKKLATFNAKTRLNEVIFSKDVASNRYYITKSGKFGADNDNLPAYAFDYKCIGVNPKIVYLGNNKDYARNILNDLCLNFNIANIYYDCLWSEEIAIEFKEQIQKLLEQVD